MLMNLTSFSQTDTQDSIICLPIGTARLIAADLLEYDKCKLILEETEELNRLANRQINSLTEAMNIYETQKTIMLAEIDALNIKYSTCDDRRSKLLTDVNELTVDNDRLKKWTIGLGSGFIATLGALFLVIAIK